VLNVLSTAGASILGVGLMLPLFYLLASLGKNGRWAGANPWGATGLEWETSSPPPTHNFESQPIVTHGPYEYERVHPRPTAEEHVGA
jgi:cytochrome c oxidase subunit 1